MIACVAAGPRHWAPRGMMYNLHSFGLPMSFPSLRAYNLASMVRAALCTCSTLDARTARFAQAAPDPESALVPRLRAWYDRSIFNNLQRALRITQQFGLLDINRRCADRAIDAAIRKNSRRHDFTTVVYQSTHYQTRFFRPDKHTVQAFAPMVPARYPGGSRR